MSEYLPLNFLGAPFVPGIGRLTAPWSGGMFMAKEVGDEFDVDVDVGVGVFVGVEMMDGSEVSVYEGDVASGDDVGDDVGVATLSMPDINDWKSEKPCPRGGLH